MLPGEIRELRLSMGLTQTEFAAKVGAQPTTISRWETGAVVPTAMAQLRLKDMAKKFHRKQARDRKAARANLV